MITKNDTVLLENKKEEQKPNSLKRLGTFSLKKGQKIFEYNFNQATLCEAEIQKSNTYCVGTYNAKRLFQKQDCIYFTSLNFANAERKIKKMVLTETKINE